MKVRISYCQHRAGLCPLPRSGGGEGKWAAHPSTRTVAKAREAIEAALAKAAE